MNHSRALYWTVIGAAAVALFSITIGCTAWIRNSLQGVVLGWGWVGKAGTLALGAAIAVAVFSICSLFTFALISIVRSTLSQSHNESMLSVLLAGLHDLRTPSEFDTEFPSAEDSIETINQAQGVKKAWLQESVCRTERRRMEAKNAPEHHACRS